MMAKKDKEDKRKKDSSEMTPREKILDNLLFKARTALLREWEENDSFEARSAFDATNPKDVV